MIADSYQIIDQLTSYIFNGEEPAGLVFSEENGLYDGIFTESLSMFDNLNSKCYPKNQIPEDGDFTSLAEMFSRRVASKHNKHVTCLIEGEPGSGKSYAALALAEACSEWIAKLKGGNPEDYFSLANVGVIDPEMIEEELSNMKEHCVYILDDAGAGIGAREFMSKMNIHLGKIIQTCRTTNNILIFTVPAGDLIDKTFRQICRYRAEIYNPMHNRGITTLKIFIQQKNSRTGKTYWHHITKGRKKVALWFTTGPRNPKLIEEYEKVRAKNARCIAAGTDIVQKKTPQKLSRAELVNAEEGSKIEELFKQGRSQYQIANQVGHTSYLVGKVLVMRGFNPTENAAYRKN